MKHVGELVGTTDSGKPVMAFLTLDTLEFPHPSTVDFTLRDHYEAMAIFAHLAIRAKHLWGDSSTDYLRYRDHAEHHHGIRGLIDSLESLRQHAGVANAFGDRELGRRLCRPEFRD